MEFKNRLEQIALGLGASYFGVADLCPAHDFIAGQGGTLPASFPLALSVAVALPSGIVDPLNAGDADTGVLVTYQRYIYDVCNIMLDTITFNLAREIESAGYSTLPVAASLRVPGKRFAGVFSHKLAAHLSGIGWIGKNCLLVTKDNGPRVRLGSLLTNMPLEPDRAIDRDCGKCNKCVESCPSGALKGQNFSSREPRSYRIDVEKCAAYRQKIFTDAGVKTCGKCVAACPFGGLKAKKREAAR